MKSKTKSQIIAIVIGAVIGTIAAVLLFSNFTGEDVGPDSDIASSGEHSENAEKVYVPRGEYDDYYLLSSGGHSGQLFVYGVPSMRKIRTVPVFTPDPATGYGYEESSKEMLDGYTWGDFHHPAISETEGAYDGKYLFANDVANNRIAAVNLSSFHTVDIMKLPNMGGPHAGAFVTENTEYIALPTRFARPLEGAYASLDDYDEEYVGIVNFTKFDQESEEFEIPFQLVLPPWSYDLSDAGKLGSGDWIVMTTYNTEFATTNLEINASQNDRDYLVMINWRLLEEAVEDGVPEQEVDGIPLLDPRDVEGAIFAVPVAKSPHGVDVTPDGEYFIASGKLAPLMTVFSFEKAFEAMESDDLEENEHGIPMLPYESVMEREVDPPGALGPLHTQFDDRGNAFNTMFISSEVVKWNIESGEVIDRTPVFYSPGHATSSQGDTVEPTGEWLIAGNKIAKDNFLSVGPSHPESIDLIDISGDAMQHVMTVPVDPEPHYSQMIKADKIETFHIYEKDEDRENSVWSPEDARIERDGDEVHVYGIAMRSKFIFDGSADRQDVVEVNEGDTVYFHLTNIDLDQDITHGFGILDYDVNYEVQPGQTATLKVEADKAGTFPLYCTNFCSALHQEMSGYLLVNPEN